MKALLDQILGRKRHTAGFEFSSGSKVYLVNILEDFSGEIFYHITFDEERAASYTSDGSAEMIGNWLKDAYENGHGKFLICRGKI